MSFITTQAELVAFLDGAKGAKYITVDTEFLRESTYYAQLCLVQIAYPGDGNAAAIDVLSKDIDLSPLMDIFRDESVVKVFHAARQDLEIFYHDYNILPKPFFDTQIAAMVGGYGDQVGYETLVRSIAKGKIDKSNRFTDWRRRPLSKAQIEYALADVTYLRNIYETFVKELSDNGRIEWVQDELEALLDPELYDTRPEEAFRRVRSRINKPKFLAYVRELAAFRERYAKENDVPRSRVFKDDALLEAAAQRPRDAEALKALRLWRGGAKPEIVKGVLQAVQQASELSPDEYPEAPIQSSEVKVSESVIDLLRVYLKAQSEQFDVAPRLICTSTELEMFIADPDGDHALNRGWRYKIYGQEAKEIMSGKAALQANGRFVKLVRKSEL